MEKRVVARYLILGILFIGLLLSLVSLKNANLTGRVILEEEGGTIERGSYWERIDYEEGTHHIKIYSGALNYNNGTEYVRFNYGSCGVNCFRDWNGLIYKVSADSKYINLYDVNGNYISSFGFGVTGDRGKGIEKFTTLNFSWTWEKETIPSTNEYIFRAYNNNLYFNWTQEYHFYPNQSMKINHTIKNNLPSDADILNAKFWYIQTIGKNDGIWFNGTRYTQDIWKTGTLDNLTAKVKFEDYYIFDYDDLLSSGFNITDFYIGTGNILGVDDIRILAIGVTKFPYRLSNGASVTLDPTIKIGTDQEGGGDAYVSKGYPNKNYGDVNELKVQRVTWQRAYLKFNISSVPDNQIIDNASLCLYLYNDQGSQRISANHVYDDSWCEGDGGSDGSPECEITWNSQPCGTDELTLDPNFCNTTEESNITTDSDGDGTWKCWNIVNMVRQEYNNNNESVSVVLWTIDSGNADKFYSKEHSDSSLWPYLNITYHTANTAPTIFIDLPQNGNSFGYNAVSYTHLTLPTN